MIWSPGSSVVRVHPCRDSMLTGPCSISHAVVLPSALVTVKNTHECGLVQRNSVTTPASVIGFFSS